MSFRLSVRVFCLFVLALCSPTLSFASSFDIAPVSGDGVSRMLYEIEVAGKSAEAEIGKLPDLINGEKTSIRNELDMWAESDLKSLIEAHYGKVRRALESTELPEDLSTVSVWWKQMKAGVALDDDLEGVVMEFIDRAEPRVAQATETFQIDMLKNLEFKSQSLLMSSMENIRRPFLDVVRGRLPLYREIPIPPLDSTRVAEVVAGSRGDLGRFSSAAILGLGAVLVLLSKRIMKRFMVRLMAKVGGKVLSKVVPVVGWILLAFEALQMAQAKDALEEELRKSYYREYCESVTVESVWFESPDGESPSMRQEMNRNIESMLSDWERICRSEALSMIQSAQVLASSERFRDNVSSELARGSDFQTLSQRMKILWDLFGLLVADESMEFFEKAVMEAPDRSELSTLARSMGSRFVELYGRYGRDYLEAVHKIGLDNYLSTDWSVSEVDWVLLNDRLDYLPDLKGDRDAAEGLLILIANDVPLEGFSPFSLARISQKEGLFLYLWRILSPDAKKTGSLFQSDKILEKVRCCMERFPQIAPLFLKTYGVEFWATWSDGDLMSLMEISTHRKKSGIPGEDVLVPAEDRVELIEIYRLAGDKGLGLWDAYAFAGSGEMGRSLAKRGVSLLSEGYPLEELKKEESLRFALWCDKIPFIGRYIFNVLNGLGWIPRALILIFLAVAVAFSLRAVSRRIGMGDVPEGKDGRASGKDADCDD